MSVKSYLNSDGLKVLVDNTKSYVDSKVASIVDSAPETLDTLNELAQALGNDENFATTVVTEIRTKAEQKDLDNLTDTVNQILNMIYPVGSIYLSVVSTSPATIFGGTWEQIEDTFLLAAGSTYSVGETGGEAEHTLVYKELPATSGSIIMHNAANGTNIAGTGGCFTSSSVNQGVYRHGGTLLEASTVSVGRINYSNGGEDQPHNNMPPYLAVYMWKRVS